VLYSGVPHAVMMGSPGDLHDFAVGFSVTEQIAQSAQDIGGVKVRPAFEGVELDISLTAACLHEFLGRRRIRSLRGHTSCGVCGVEELAELRLNAPLREPAAATIAPEAISAALASLRDHQPLARQTRGAHAAAWAALDGRIVAAREDVGRHNALDKLIGAGLRGGLDLGSGFCVITSRCSFEMAHKAAVAGIGTLVAVSAPTALAIRTAEAGGLSLMAQARPGSYLVCTQAARANA
jgi:FdhD protein